MRWISNWIEIIDFVAIMEIFLKEKEEEEEKNKLFIAKWL